MGAERHPRDSLTRDLSSRFHDTVVAAGPAPARQFVFGDDSVAVLVETGKEFGLRRSVFLQSKLAGVARINALEDACIELAVARQFQLIELIGRHEGAAMGSGLELLMQCGVEFCARDLAVAI